MPKKHIYWIVSVLLVSIFSAWCADPYAATFRYMVRKVRTYAIRPLSERELFDAGVSGMLASIDKNSSYIPPKYYEDLNQELNQESGTLGILYWRDDASGKYYVGSTLPQSPARRAGILPGMEIAAVDGLAFQNLSWDEAVMKMNPPLAVEIMLDVLDPRTKKNLSIPLTSQKMTMESVTGIVRQENGIWNYMLPPLPTVSKHQNFVQKTISPPKSGVSEPSAQAVSTPKPGVSEPAKTAVRTPRVIYARLNTFGERTASELRQVLIAGTKAQAEGLILDLRGNGGGLFETATVICGMFLPPGCVVVNVVKAYDAEPHSISIPSRKIWEKPVVILVDGDTASASEILAACLQDYASNGQIQAVCVGTRTYGKGTIQNIFDLGPIPDDRYIANETSPKTLWEKIWEKPVRGGFRISVEEYKSPNGRRIHRFPGFKAADQWGVMPDKGWEIDARSNPWRRHDPENFESEYISFEMKRLTGALKPEQTSEIYDFDIQLKRAMEFFYQQPN